MNSYRDANNKNERCETCGHCAQDTRYAKKRSFRCYWTYHMRNNSIVSVNKVCDEYKDKARGCGTKLLEIEGNK